MKSADVSIWVRPMRAARGPAPSRDRSSIAQAAVAIADAKGIEAVSMRRVAETLAIGTMSLYRYVANKSELMELMVDAVRGEAAPPVQTGNWRADLRAIARANRGLLLRHPWAVDLAVSLTLPGPNGLMWLEANLRCLDGLGVDGAVILRSINTLNVFVRGYVSEELAAERELGRTGIPSDAWMNRHEPYVSYILSSGDYPLLSHVITASKAPHDTGRRNLGFDEGLDRIIDGIGMHLYSKLTSRL